MKDVIEGDMEVCEAEKILKIYRKFQGDIFDAVIVATDKNRNPAVSAWTGSDGAVSETLALRLVESMIGYSGPGHITTTTHPEDFNLAFALAAFTAYRLTKTVYTVDEVLLAAHGGQVARILAMQRHPTAKEWDGYRPSR